MSTDENENGWDALAENLGVESAPLGDKPGSAVPARASCRPATHRDPRPEIEQEAEDFGSGVSEEARSRGALYDPGPETVVDHAADIEDVTDPLDDGAEGDEPSARDDGMPDEGGKRRRRRRRRKKKGGGVDVPAEEESAEAGESDDEADTVEEGEAPAELEGDDDDEAAPSAVDEEMDAEAAQPRPEWHVMSWAELVSKLHRPG